MNKISVYRSRAKQRGVSTLLFISLVAIGLAAATTTIFRATQGTQKLQHAEHTVTQAEMLAWSGVSLLSKAIAQMPSDAAFTVDAQVAFTGAPAGLSAVYKGKQNGLHVFDVVGASAGARSVLRTAVKPASTSGSSGDTTLPSGITLRGKTTVEGDVTYTGATQRNLYVLDGDLTMTGSVNGLNEVCATGDISIGAAIQVTTVCTNGSVTFNGSANATAVKARGDVTLAGGAASSIGTIASNGMVKLTGGSATAGSISAIGNVTVSGGNAKATSIRTAGNIDWTSSAVAASLAANGTVNYRPSGTTVATDIDALGSVQVTSARNVRTKGATTLVGYYGQGITGRLDGQGLLGGSSWGSGGGAVVSSGTVGSIVSPYPNSVKVTVSPGYTVNVAPLVIPEVPVFSLAPATVDAYALQPQANFSFTGVDAAGNPRVKVAGVNGVADGNYLVAAKAGGGENYLCQAVSGATCVTPLIKICQGYSNSNKCFSRTSAGKWTIEGTTMLPSVVWFEGDLVVSNGAWVNTFLATGDLSTSGGIKVYSPNYVGSNYVCQGKANATPSLSAWTAYGFSATSYATQLCSGNPAVLKGSAIGNIALLAGGLNGSTYVGGNIVLGSSTEVYGAVMAGQYLTTGGSTVVAGAILAAGQGGSTAQTGNRQGGSTTIKIDGGGSSAYNPDKAPCMSNCQAEPSAASNIVWAAPA